jgi:glycyl-tRNA synthetase
MFLAVLSSAYKEEKVSRDGEDGGERVVLRIPAALAPNKVAVLPLVKKDGLPEKAQAIMNELKFDLRCYYEDKDTIGRRYRRQDAIGTPYCITIDHQTLQDDTVTIRNRDTLEQERVAVSALKAQLSEACSINSILKKI